MKHYILTAGLSGFMPNYLAVHHSNKEAAECAREVLEIGTKKTTLLKRDGWVGLNMRYHGNEYAKITECDCDNMRNHFESDAEYQEFIEE
jgi:hypothetical protein